MSNAHDSSQYASSSGSQQQSREYNQFAYQAGSPFPPSAPRHQTNPNYAASTYSTSTTATELPLLNTSEGGKAEGGKGSKVWKKTKTFLSKVGDPNWEAQEKEKAEREKAEKEGREYRLKGTGMGFGMGDERKGGGLV